jgi:hypothetical protein
MHILIASIMNVRHTLLTAVLWLTRTAGVVTVLLGLATFVSALRDRSFGLVVMGCAVVAAGAVMMSLRLVGDDRLQYRLLRWPSRH